MNEETEDYLDDVYRDGIAEDLMDQDEISSEEEAFLRGYNDFLDMDQNSGEA